MKNKTIALAGALLIGGLLTFNGIAFADVADTQASASIQKPVKGDKAWPDMKGGPGHKGAKGMIGIQKQDWGTQLKELVAAGTITQATADKIQAYITEQNDAARAEKEKLQAMTPEQLKAYFESKKTETFKKLDLFSAMVEKGVITQQQADGIKSKLQSLQQAKQQESIKTSLNQLVENKTITQEQATKVTEYISKQQAAKAAEMEKVKEMTAEEREAYFKDKTAVRSSVFAQMLTDKVLTQEQADAVAKALHTRGFTKVLKPDAQNKIKTVIPKV